MLERVKGLFKRKAVTNQDLQDKYKRVFGSPEGKEVLEHILRSCCMTESTFVAGDALTSAHNEGRRSVGIHVLSILEAEQKPQHNIEEI